MCTHDQILFYRTLTLHDQKSTNHVLLYALFITTIITFSLSHITFGHMAFFVCVIHVYQTDPCTT